MPRRKHIELLLHKAEQNERTLDILLQDGTAPTESVGFHAQQAAEKLPKAAIKATGAEYPLSHDLWRLFRLLTQIGVEVPDEVRAMRELTAYAGEFRYDALPADGTTLLEPTEVRQRLRDLRAWVEAFVEERHWGESSVDG